jgi:glycosyltransferase involved in cell wall biosynthesis
MRRLLVNDMLTSIPGTKTFWHDLIEWFAMDFVGGDYSTLAEDAAEQIAGDGSLIIRNASWFPPIETPVPQISLLQDIFEEGPAREMQMSVIRPEGYAESKTMRLAVVYNSEFTKSKYVLDVKGFPPEFMTNRERVIPLPVDFDLFEPQNAMGLQQRLGLPDGAVCWIGSQHPIKGYDIFIQIVRANPDIPFVGVFKDQAPAYGPPNLRAFTRLPHDELVKVIGACRVGLCTSRSETQHLAGIEMGACGLPMVAPPVGVYWNRDDLPGVVVQPGGESIDGGYNHYSTGIRMTLGEANDPQQIRAYWKKEFSRSVVMAQWVALVQEVECSGRS